MHLVSAPQPTPETAPAPRYLFADYRTALAPHTISRQDADLRSFWTYLAEIGVQVGDLATDPSAWVVVTRSVLAGFRIWLLNQGYAIGTVNVRLATLKAYCRQAYLAGVLDSDAYHLLQSVSGYAGRQARNLDARRRITRLAAKKPCPVPLTREQAQALKQHPDTPQGRRDTLLLCLLLDHGLRLGEIALLTVAAFNGPLLAIYRPKVDIAQTHRLSDDALVAALAYLRLDAPADPLWRGSRADGSLVGTWGERAMRARVRLLGQRLGIANLSPHDCRHAWATSAMRGGTDVAALQDAGGWASPLMPLRYASASRIANERVRLA